MLSAILFDLDGTLADTERENAESVARALAGAGRPMTEEERAFVVGHGWREIYALLERNRPTGFTFEALKAAATGKKAEILRAGGLRELPGARAAIERFAGRCPVGVVTGSGREEAELVLDLLGVRARLGCLVAVEDVAHGKPAPDGYLLGATRLGAPAGACLVVEDAPPGIRAARAAGMRCVAVGAGNFAGFDQSEADAVIPSLCELDDGLLSRLGLAPPGAD